MDKMTVKEVADVFGVTAEAIKKHIRELYPDIIQNGVIRTAKGITSYAYKPQRRKGC